MVRKIAPETYTQRIKMHLRIVDSIRCHWARELRKNIFWQFDDRHTREHFSYFIIKFCVANKKKKIKRTETHKKRRTAHKTPIIIVQTAYRTLHTARYIEINCVENVRMCEKLQLPIYPFSSSISSSKTAMCFTFVVWSGCLAFFLCSVINLCINYM